jgi:hypothetical protein
MGTPAVHQGRSHQPTCCELLRGAGGLRMSRDELRDLVRDPVRPYAHRAHRTAAVSP